MTQLFVPATSGARVGPGLTAGLAGEAALLLVLGATVGVHLAGGTAGATVAVAAAALLSWGLRRARAVRLGPANAVTLARTVVVGGVTALAVDALVAGGRPGAHVALVTLAAVALALDGVDGLVARRTGTATPLGARFDMEVDAFLILVLSALLVPAHGRWVLAIGLMRYAFVVAGVVLPWLRASLPPRAGRKLVAAAQGVLLLVAVSGVLPGRGSTGVVAAALAALCWSFARDVRLLAVIRTP